MFTPPMLAIHCPSLAHTHAIAAALAGVVRSGDVIALAGEMGTGKTAFAQGFATALGVNEPVTSPTFTLVHTYASPRWPVHHADVYRLEKLHEVADLALLELVEAGGVLLVEWGDAVAAALGEHLEVRLEFDGLAGGPAGDAGEGERTGSGDDGSGGDGGARRLVVTPRGVGWLARWPAISSALKRAP